MRRVGSPTPDTNGRRINPYEYRCQNELRRNPIRRSSSAELRILTIPRTLVNKLPAPPCNGKRPTNDLILWGERSGGGERAGGGVSPLSSRRSRIQLQEPAFKAPASASSLPLCVGAHHGRLR